MGMVAHGQRTGVVAWCIPLLSGCVGLYSLHMCTAQLCALNEVGMLCTAVEVGGLAALAASHCTQPSHTSCLALSQGVPGQS